MAKKLGPGSVWRICQVMRWPLPRPVPPSGRLIVVLPEKREARRGVTVKGHVAREPVSAQARARTCCGPGSSGFHSPPRSCAGRRPPSWTLFPVEPLPDPDFVVGAGQITHDKSQPVKTSCNIPGVLRTARAYRRTLAGEIPRSRAVISTPSMSMTGFHSEAGTGEDSKASVRLSRYRSSWSESRPKPDGLIGHE